MVLPVGSFFFQLGVQRNLDTLECKHSCIGFKSNKTQDFESLINFKLIVPLYIMGLCTSGYNSVEIRRSSEEVWMPKDGV